MPIGRSTTARLLRPFPPAYRARKDGTTVRITAGPEASADRSGTVSASTTITGTVAGSKTAPDTVSATITASATIVGRKAAPDAVAGTITVTGTVAGREGHSGAATGSLTATGTTSGYKAASGAVTATVYSTGIISGAEHHFGQVTAVVTSTATVVGTKDEPQPPSPPPTTGGGSPYYARHYVTPRPRTPQRDDRRGSVRAVTHASATAQGHRATFGAVDALIATHTRSAGAKRVTSSAYGRTLSRWTDHISPRIKRRHRQRDEDDLLLLIEMERP